MSTRSSAPTRPVTGSLIYLNAPPEPLRQRLCARADRFDANTAFPITDELLGCMAAFEKPQGEGDEVILVTGDET